MKNPLLQRLLETRVLENYSFMTALNIFSALIGLMIYPYIIRVTGKDAYGSYVYALTIAGFFQSIVDYGFESPCAKAIVLAKDDLIERGRVVSTVLVLKFALIIFCALIFGICMAYVPFMRNRFSLCLLTFIQLVADSLFPVWYFQGMKKMKFVTYIYLGLRLSTIPFILWLVHAPQDIGVFAFITMLSVICGTLISYLLVYIDGIRPQKISSRRLLSLFKDSTPFFATSLTSSLRGLTIKSIIKYAFGVGEVAIYDLAEKIISIPRFLTRNINGALFPEVVDKATTERVQRILKYERIIGLSMVVLVALLSYPAVLLLGGEKMLDAVHVTILLSIVIYSELVVGAYINFIFIPSNRYYTITTNQIISFISSVLLIIIGLLVWRDITMVVLGVVASGFLQILFCYWMTKKRMQ